MRTFELRVYQLRDRDRLDFYSETIYPNHLRSFHKFGIEAHGFWTAAEADGVLPRLFALVSYPEGENVDAVTRRYMRSAEFAADIKDFDVSNIVSVETTILTPSLNSPLK